MSALFFVISIILCFEVRTPVLPPYIENEVIEAGRSISCDFWF